MSDTVHWYSSQHLAITLINNKLQEILTNFDTSLCVECSLRVSIEDKDELEQLLLGLYVYITRTYRYDDWMVHSYTDHFTRRTFIFLANMCINVYKSKILAHIVPNESPSFYTVVTNEEALAIFSPYYNLLHLLNDFSSTHILIEDDRCVKSKR